MEETEEDFDAMYADEYEAMLEMEGRTQSANTQSSQKVVSPRTNQSQDLFQTQLDKTTQSNLDQTTQSTQSNHVTSSQTAKRNIQDLFGDIDDILNESPFLDAPASKKSKQDKETEDFQLIDRILQLREAAKYQAASLTGFGTTADVTRFYDEASNIAYAMPKWPFIVVRQYDGRKKYIRFHNKDYEDEAVRKVSEMFTFEDGISATFRDTWDEAKNILKLQEEVSELETLEKEVSPTEISLLDSKSLWVEKYKPKRYMELLSDESTNRILLRWLKLWDKVVFNRRPKVKPVVKAEDPFKGKSKFQKFEKKDLTLKLADDGRPEFKVALLCGPPGLGKTTLAHLVAKHAGYNPVEINASDDRSTEAFRTALDRGTQMRSVLDKENRPNCLIFDEIDGAPPASIEFLIKYINGTYKPKGSKAKGAGKTGKKTQALKRPIICICNDMYVPALRPLRQISFLVNFPPTDSSRLAERLLEISLKQTIDTNLTALLALSEKSNNDIRSCLSVLQFFRAQNKPVRLDDVLQTAVGQKDIQKGLFSIWQDIFQIQRPKNKDKDQMITGPYRLRHVLSAITAFGDYERVMHGVFDNYPSMKVKGRCIPDICASLEWFGHFDILSRRMLATQNYSLNPYLPYAFVIWHFAFSSFAWQKIQYPNTGYEVRTKQGRNTALLTEILKGTQPYLKPFVHKKNLTQEILPYLSGIILPTFRPVNTHLYTENEKQRLCDIIGKMIDYNITYVQERTVDGDYVYNMDPNVAEVTEFSSITEKKRCQVSYSNKQLISREIELEKMRQAIQFKNKHNVNENCENKSEKNRGKTDNSKKDKDANVVPNHLQKLNVVAKKISTTEKDIFGNVVPKSKSNKLGLEILNDVWFQYNEGFTNAVRRPLLIKDLL